MGDRGWHLSISMIFSTEDDSNSGEVMRFSTAKTTPCLHAISNDEWNDNKEVHTTWLSHECTNKGGKCTSAVWMPMDVEPSLMASSAYST